ncbi:MAG TPA: hypothetical protein DCS97_02435 [Planctomycetes bacterium]|nr:hypothetical protein [Planctomycetota bacterium]
MHHRSYNRLLIGVALLALVAVLGSNALQLAFHSGPTSVVTADPELGWRFRGQRNQQEMGLADFPLRFNARGCRGPESTGDESRGRTVFLGNSVTLGQHVPEDRTFASLADGINAGGDGYDTYQQLRHFRCDLADLKPQRVVLMITATDLMTAAASRERMRSTAAANPDLAPLLQRLTDIRQARRIFSHGFRPKGDDRPDPGRDNAYLAAAMAVPDPQVWRDWTTSIDGLAKEIGAGHLTLVLSPPRLQVLNCLPGTKETPLATALREFCSTRKIGFHDLLPDLAVANPQELYCDHVHFSERGHALVAEILTRTGIR